MTVPRNNMPNHNPNSRNFDPNYQNHSNSRNFARPYPYPYHRYPPPGYAMDQEHPRGNESPDLVRSQSSVTSPLTHEEYEDLAKSMRNDFQSSQNRCVLTKMSKFKASLDKSRLVDLMRSHTVTRLGSVKHHT